MTEDQLSVVSNGRKLLYNADTLLNIRNGHARPIMFTVSPTNRCQLECPFCCYGRRASGEELSLNSLKKFADDCARLGTRTWELAGGGEPSLYPYINELIEHVHQLNFHLGICTNGVSLDRIEHPEWFQWIRVSLHGIEKHAGRLAQNVRHVQKAGTKISSCFVVTEETINSVPKIQEFADNCGVLVKMEPNPYMGAAQFFATADLLRSTLPEGGRLFVDSDTKFGNTNRRCFMHLLKPFLYTNGWICPCPLPVGPIDGLMDKEFYVCRMENVYDYYTNGAEIGCARACRFCRNEVHNEIAEGVLFPLDDKEYC